MKDEIKAYNNVLELIGNTPLIKLSKVTADMSGDFMQKLKLLIQDILQKTASHYTLLKKLKDKEF